MNNYSNSRSISRSRIRGFCHSRTKKKVWAPPQSPGPGRKEPEKKASLEHPCQKIWQLTGTWTAIPLFFALAGRKRRQQGKKAPPWSQYTDYGFGLDAVVDNRKRRIPSKQLRREGENFETGWGIPSETFFFLLGGTDLGLPTRLKPILWWIKMCSPLMMILLLPSLSQLGHVWKWRKSWFEIQSAAS